ncbi:eukaryotic RNA polymerase II heptapeptide repeat [Striga asiatica]|uniref:Eukaryotic RNA polymerase II heptapeptide repeat n=1 Tax=Striga asiatica TaxID=4170 RepID=A0A5A7QXA7_STRAF|nr:eukaryotic RNA polymerase II heptapeptide repeat [Striga asiatica]
MAQLERTRRSTNTQKMPTTQTSPAFEQMLRVDEACWSPTTSPTSEMNHAHQEESLSPSQNRKSVLAKVKERAKKLKHSLSGRKNINENDLNDENTTPHSGLVLDDHNDDDPTDDPEYLGAPMYESEAAPEGLKENARQHPRAVPVVSESHRTPIRTKLSDTSLQENENETNVTKAVPQISAQPHNIITSKISGLTVSPKTPNRETVRIGNQEKSGKLSPVKEHSMNKVEPVEDERALSRALTEAISPNKINNNTSVVGKVKEAVNSFFWNEETSNSAARPVGPRLYNSDASSAPRYPLSSNARAVAEEENHGKILQTN